VTDVFAGSVAVVEIEPLPLPLPQVPVPLQDHEAEASCEGIVQLTGALVAVTGPAFVTVKLKL
jgi:hypothetical protein